MKRSFLSHCPVVNEVYRVHMPINARALPVNVTHLHRMKNYHVHHCSHKRDEMYLRSVSDRQVRAIFNMLQIGQLKFGGSSYKTSFKSRCLARGKRTPTNL